MKRKYPLVTGVMFRTSFLHREGNRPRSTLALRKRDKGDKQRWNSDKNYQLSVRKWRWPFSRVCGKTCSYWKQNKQDSIVLGVNPNEHSEGTYRLSGVLSLPSTFFHCKEMFWWQVFYSLTLYCQKLGAALYLRAQHLTVVLLPPAVLKRALYLEGSYSRANQLYWTSPRKPPVFLSNGQAKT